MLTDYGEGFVLYRDAEHLRRKAGRYLEAYMLYDEIENKFPKSVYSEASGACRLKCLLSLAEKENLQHAKETILRAKDAVKAKRKQLFSSGRKKASPEEKKEIREEMEDGEKRIARMQLIPVGDRAAVAAEKLASSGF